MRSELNTTLRGLTAGILILVAGCGGGGGGGSAEAPPPPPVEPGNTDTTPIDGYPSIKYLYFLGDDYKDVDVAGEAPLIRAYQHSVTGNTTVAADKTRPAELIRPKVAPSRGNMTYSYVILKEQQGYWLMAPDQQVIRRLTDFSSKYGTSCDEANPTTDLARFFLNHRTFFYGVTRANSGTYTFTTGPDGQCHTADDQYWQIALNATEIEAPKQIAREIALGQELLDADLNLLGFIYAEPGQQIKTYDKDMNPIATLETADGYVSLNKHYDGNLTVLVIGRSLYLVDNREVVKPGFTLPMPLYTASAAIDENNVRLDQDRVYLIDGTKLLGFNYSDGSQSFNSQDQSGSFSSLSFGNFQNSHSQVFTKNQVIVLAQSADTKNHLVAFDKETALRSILSVETSLTDDDPPVESTTTYNVAADYFATDHYVYGSYADPAEGDDGFEAVIWENMIDSSNGTADLIKRLPEGMASLYELGRWYFYQDHGQGSSRHWALLMLSKKPTEDTSAIRGNGFFSSPSFYRFDPESPDPANVAPTANSSQSLDIGLVFGQIKLKELASAQSGHLLFTTERAESASNDFLDIYYYNPETPRIPATRLKSEQTGQIVCDRAITDTGMTSTSPPCGIVP